jgi:hypothetical protein
MATLKAIDNNRRDSVNEGETGMNDCTEGVDILFTKSG